MEKTITGYCNAEVEHFVNNCFITKKTHIEKNRALLDHLVRTLVDQNDVLPEELAMMQVEFGVFTFMNGNILGNV